MCGRFNVIDDPLSKLVSDWLKIDFKLTESNVNVCPSQRVDCIVAKQESIAQSSHHWGLPTDWSKKLLINARSETVFNKSTFAQAFAQSRCLVPVSSWYEWKSDNSGRKVKYEFTSTEGGFLMAGLLVNPSNLKSQQQSFDLEPPAPADFLVTLTTAANTQCRPIHSRMPLMISKDAAQQWLYGGIEQAKYLLVAEIAELNLKAV